MKKVFLPLAVVFALLFPGWAQSSATRQLDSRQIDNPRADNPKVDNPKVDDSPKPGNSKIDNAFVQRQFGSQFTLMADVAPAFGDLDGDGIEDVVITARCKNPMLDQAEHNYTVVDPYYDFFGYGDPKVTTTFSEGNPALRGLVVLIVEGSSKEGSNKEAWRSATPKAKFVLVNLPYRAVSVRKLKLRKRMVEAIYVEESGETGESSAVFFDGKKFRYVPMGGDMQ